MGAGVDLNILIYAIDKSSAFHQKAYPFLNSLVNSDKTVFLTWDTIYSLIRICTHPGIFSYPFSPQEAVDNASQLINHPNIEILSHTSDSWKIYLQLQTEMKIRGNLVPDAVIASILEANGIRELYTNDRDFWKFPFLKPKNPFSD